MRILIVTVTAGGGHLAAAAALNEAWKTLHPRDEVEQLDLLTYASTIHRKLYSDAYIKVASGAPELWGFMFEKTDSPKVARGLNQFRKLFLSNTHTRFQKLIKQTRPDVVLCTHPLPLETLGRMRAKSLKSRTPAARGDNPFVVSIVTDFEAHAFWMEEHVDLYCVAAEETKARLVARGANAENVVVTGIPIAAKFKARIRPAAVRKQHGLRDDMPVVLVLSGGFGMGPVGEILTELDKVKKPFQTLVVCGRNEELRRELAGHDRKHPTHVLGFTTNMHELMAIADIIITKPGGLTSSEALALGRPLFIFNPIPGQEAANSDFLLERGAAAKVNRVEDVPYRIEQLLGSKKLAEMAKAAKALGHPDAAETLCKEVLKRFQQPTAKQTKQSELTE